MVSNQKLLVPSNTMTKGKRKVKFQEPFPEDGEASFGKRANAQTKSRRFKENHSLDSDEELEVDDKKKVVGEDILDEDDIEGQEDETIRFDDGISVTPFNLKDELEEGHFDAQGNYIANKEDPDATDGWLESVDWNSVESQTKFKKLKKKKKEEEDKEDEKDSLSPLKIMQDMLKLMKPSENVLKSLRRLGGNKKAVSSADRWKKKKLGLVAEEPVDAKAEEDKRDLLLLTGLADDLLQKGDFQIYEKTREQLAFEISKKVGQFEDADSEEAGPSKKCKLGDDAEKEEIKEEIKEEKMEQDDDSDDELEATFRKKVADNNKTLKQQDTEVKSESVDISLSSEISWFYKVDNTETCEPVVGPLTSTKMLEMHEGGEFGDDGVYCRKVGSEGEFYNSKRIDFDLYI